MLTASPAWTECSEGSINRLDALGIAAREDAQPQWHAVFLDGDDPCLAARVGVQGAIAENLIAHAHHRKVEQLPAA
jgi:hypothetical protein